MNKRHTDLARRIVALMKVEPDFELINSIRIVNDGGGTGTFGVRIDVHGKKPKAVSVSMHLPSAEAEDIPADTYWDDES
jgi:hypothetical protein